MKSISSLTVAGLLAVTLVAPAPLLAQNTNKPTSATSATTGANNTTGIQKKPRPGPFHGNLVAVDKAARTITVGKRRFYLTAETRIRKGDKPATLEDGVVGEPVSGYIMPLADGRLVAKSVNFGPKAGGSRSLEKKKTTEAK